MKNKQTKILGIIGNPITHSASPFMHNQEMKRLKLNYTYIPLCINDTKIDLKNTIQSIRTLKMTGLNVTIPFKVKVIPFLDHCAPSAVSAGAVNTIINNNGILTGYNTDGEGFITSLFEETNANTLTNKNICIIGAGGACKGILSALITHSIQKITIINRTLSKATSLLETIKDKKQNIEAIQINTNKAHTTLQSADIVIQTTPVGLTSNKIPTKDTTWVNKDQLIIDIIYNPEKTPFLMECEKKGAKIINGVGMLAGQGILAFEKFTGKKASYKQFKKYINQYLKKGDL